jgi:hypothetical protein
MVVRPKWVTFPMQIYERGIASIQLSSAKDYVCRSGLVAELKDAAPGYSVCALLSIEMAAFIFRCGTLPAYMR